MTEQTTDIRKDIKSILADIYNAQKSGVKSSLPSKENLVGLVTELLSLGLSEKESELVTDILINLLRQVQEDVCLALAQRVSSMSNVPTRLMKHIVCEDISIARFALRDSPVFSDEDLIYVIRSQSSDYWREIAQRKGFGFDVVDALIDTGDLCTALHLSQNEHVTLDFDRLLRLAQMGEKDSDLVKYTLGRSEVTQAIFSSIYQSVGESVKFFISQEFSEYMDVLSSVVDEVVVDFLDTDTSNADSKTDLPGANSSDNTALQEDNDAGVSGGRDDDYFKIVGPDVFIESLQKADIRGFLGDFSRYLSLDLGVVENIVMEESGKGLCVLCKSVDISKRHYVTMYSLLKNNVIVGAGVSLKQRSQAGRNYDQMSKSSAVYILNKLRRG